MNCPEPPPQSVSDISEATQPRTSESSAHNHQGKSKGIIRGKYPSQQFTLSSISQKPYALRMEAPFRQSALYPQSLAPKARKKPSGEGANYEYTYTPYGTSRRPRTMGTGSSVRAPEPSRRPNRLPRGQQPHGGILSAILLEPPAPRGSFAGRLCLAWPTPKGSCLTGKQLQYQPGRFVVNSPKPLNVFL